MARHRSKRSNRSRSRGQIGVGLLASGVALVLATSATHSMARVRVHPPTNPEAAFEATNVKVVLEALSRYAAHAQDGRLFPAADEWIDELADRGLLPGNVLPPSPWKAETPWYVLHTPTYRQANTPDWPKGLVDAGQLVRGARASAVGTSLGLGHLPERNTFEANTYGALLYDVDRTGQVAVLYAVGQRGNNAVVAGVHPLGQPSLRATRLLRQPLVLVGQSFKVTERAPNHDTVAWHITVKNRGAVEMPAYLTLIFQGGSTDDTLKVSGTRVDLPPGRTMSFDGEDTLGPGQGALVRQIVCENDGKPI